MGTHKNPSRLFNERSSATRTPSTQGSTGDNLDFDEFCK